MKRKRHSEEQTVSILNEREAGASAADLARMRGASPSGRSTAGSRNTEA